MNEFIKKLIEKLEECQNHFDSLAMVGKDDLVMNYNLGKKSAYKNAVEIVKQLAEECKDDIHTIDVSELLGVEEQENKSTKRINRSTNYENGYEDGWNDCMETIQASAPYQPKG